MKKTIEKRATVVAKCEQFKRVHHESMRYVYVEALVGHDHLDGVLHARTLGDYVNATPLVNYACANFNLN